jgi:hypothetical protein
MDRHEYFISGTTCPKCGFKDCRIINNQKYWCVSCDTYFPIDLREKREWKSMPNKLPKNWRGRMLK